MTEYRCLLVDLDDGTVAETIEARPKDTPFPMPVVVANIVDEALRQIEQTSVVFLGIFAHDYSDDLKRILEAYQKFVGPIADFQLLVCDDPAPTYMTQVFEFGVERFSARQNWQADLAQALNSCIECLEQPDSPETKTIRLAKVLKSSDQAAIAQARQDVGDMKDYDYRAAFVVARASEALGNLDAAIDEFQKASTMNRMFRPSQSSLGESLMTAGRYDEAITVFQKLEKTNPFSVERKTFLASALMEKGRTEEAKELIAAAERMEPDNSRIAEAKAQMFLDAGETAKAFEMMEKLHDVGPYFASRLNSLGIKLSQAGKGKSALALYKRAHKIVRPELRYKISLNAALACHRIGEFSLALKHVERCRHEFGRDFDKLAKIRRAVEDALQKQQITTAAS